mmetsp:Transcript_6992/g.19825  ORF Transcript_6992/g.19825 Transcript_6992/m.19825 type:complete len:411 (-) Transcript_6992:34-1266(-)
MAAMGGPMGPGGPQGPGARPAGLADLPTLALKALWRRAGPRDRLALALTCRAVWAARPADVPLVTHLAGGDAEALAAAEGGGGQCPWIWMSEAYQRWLARELPLDSALKGLFQQQAVPALEQLGRDETDYRVVARRAGPLLGTGLVLNYGRFRGRRRRAWERSRARGRRRRGGLGRADEGPPAPAGHDSHGPGRQRQRMGGALRRQRLPRVRRERENGGGARNRLLPHDAVPRLPQVGRRRRRGGGRRGGGLGVCVLGRRDDGGVAVAGDGAPGAGGALLAHRGRRRAARGSLQADLPEHRQHLVPGEPPVRPGLPLPRQGRRLRAQESRAQGTRESVRQGSNPDWMGTFRDGTGRRRLRVRPGHGGGTGGRLPEPWGQRGSRGPLPAGGRPGAAIFNPNQKSMNGRLWT